MSRARRALDDFWAGQGLPAKDTWPFQVALDEVLSNIVRYGLQGGDAGRQLEIGLRFEQGVFEVTVRDDAPPFDPLQAKAPDLSVPADQRPIGGLGIAIVKKLMDRVDYERRDGHNYLSFKKRLARDGGGSIMDIREERAGGTLVVAPLGRIDSTTSEALERRLLQLVAAREHRLVLDMQGVLYISSAGLRVFLVLLSRLREANGTLVLCALGEGVREVFELAGFLSIFTVEPTRSAAIGRVQEPL